MIKTLDYVMEHAKIIIFSELLIIKIQNTNQPFMFYVSLSQFVSNVQTNRWPLSVGEAGCAWNYLGRYGWHYVNELFFGQR